MQNQNLVPQEDHLLNIKQVKALTTFSHSHIYNLIGRGEFPHPIRSGKRSTWSNGEIQAWIKDRLANPIQIGRPIGSLNKSQVMKANHD